MGTGSGVIAIFLEMVKEIIQPFSPEIYASDILNASIRCAKNNELLNYKENRIEFIKSDLFKAFPNNFHHKFDIIVFNPPYLPSIEHEIPTSKASSYDKSWNGGLKGYETFLTFLDNAKTFLNYKKPHYIYSICSSSISIQEFKEEIREMDFKCRVLKKTHIFFEDIYMIKLVYRNKL